jgi:hypothetical protein
LPITFGYFTIFLEKNQIFGCVLFLFGKTICWDLLLEGFGDAEGWSE